MLLPEISQTCSDSNGGAQSSNRTAQLRWQRAIAASASGSTSDNTSSPASEERSILPRLRAAERCTAASAIQRVALMRRQCQRLRFRASSQHAESAPRAAEDPESMRTARLASVVLGCRRRDLPSTASARNRNSSDSASSGGDGTTGAVSDSSPRQRMSGHFTAYVDACNMRMILPKFSRAAQAGLDNEEMDLSGLGMGDAQLECLLCDDDLVPADRISWWRIRDARLTDVGVAALGKKLHEQVKVLDLADNELGSRGVEAMRGLTNGYNYTFLRCLNLSRNGMKSDAVAFLCKALAFSQMLLRLELNSNLIEDGAPLGELCRSHANLTRVAVHNNQLGATGVAALFRGVLDNANKDGRVADIDVAWNGIGDGEVKDTLDCASEIAKVLRARTSLYHLDLSYNSIDSKACKLISDALSDNHSLYGLHMVGNEVTMDANGFLIPSVGKFAKSPRQAEVTFGHQLGDSTQRLGAQRQKKEVTLRESSARRRLLRQEGVSFTDEDVLRERDGLEHQTPCWACEGWQRIDIEWPVEEDPAPRAVWAFTNIDAFRHGQQLLSTAGGDKFVGARMVPPNFPLRILFQVDGELRIPSRMATEKLAPIHIELRLSKDLPEITAPAGSSVLPASVRTASGVVVTIPHVGVPSSSKMKTTQVDTPGSMGLRMVQIQDPGGNIVQMPRITETEFKAKVKTIRPKALLAPFRRDTQKHIKKCFELDWTMTKMSRLIPEGERDDVMSYLEANYAKFLALYRHASSIGIMGVSSFGVSSLEAANVAVETGMVDGKTTKLADVDRFFIAAKVTSTDSKKDLLVRNEKGLVRYQLLEFIVRIADQRFLQSKEASTMKHAVMMAVECVSDLANSRQAEMEKFLAAISTNEVDDTLRKHLAGLEGVYDKFSGRACQPGQANFMSLGEFQDLLEVMGVYDETFQLRNSAMAFRMGMQTQHDEYYSSRLQEMSFLEFLHGICAVSFLKTSVETLSRLGETIDVLLTAGLAKVLS